jgi:hypothetical protein
LEQLYLLLQSRINQKGSDNFLNEITFILGSVTKATRVRRQLSSRGIKSEMAKRTCPDTGECMHGVKTKKSDMYSAIAILRELGVEYTVENDIP